MLRGTLGGVTGSVEARARSGGVWHSWTVRRLAINGTERIVTPPGSFVANRAELTGIGRRFMARAAARIRALRHARRDRYAARATITRTNSLAISQARARRVCQELTAGSGIRPRLVGHGTTEPIGDNTPLRGRAMNRRVVVTPRH